MEPQPHHSRFVTQKLQKDQRQNARYASAKLHFAVLMDTYGHVCAFTGPQLEETLQAAHIQPYVDAQSNHVRNGLLLRADIHVLFDFGLLTLTPDLRIQVSSKLKGRDPVIERLNGATALLKNAITIEPSVEAMAFHRREVFT